MEVTRLASIRKRSTSRGVRYDVRYRDPAGADRTRSFSRKVDADRFAATVESDKVRGLWVDPSAGRVSFREYAEQRWLPAQIHLRPNTLELYEGHLRRHVLPAIGGRPLAAIQRPEVKTLVARLAQNLAPATVATVYAVARMVMQSAVDDGLLAANPCSRVPLPRVERQIVAPLPPELVVALADAITPRYRAAVLLAAAAGLREGEVLGLRVDRIDFLRRRIHVEEQLQRGNLAPLKTKASRRVVPIDDGLVTVLSEHVRRYRRGQDDLLILNRSGRPVGRSTFGECWRRAVEAAGAPSGTRFHQLRSFYASTLIAAGLHPKAIQARLGHAKISETMDTYGALFPNAENLGRGAVDAALGLGPRGIDVASDA